MYSMSLECTRVAAASNLHSKDDDNSRIEKSSWDFREPIKIEQLLKEQSLERPANQAGNAVGYRTCKRDKHGAIKDERAADKERERKEQRLLKKLRSLPAVSFNIIKNVTPPETLALPRDSQADESFEWLRAGQDRQSKHGVATSSVKIEDWKQKLMEIPVVERPVKRPLTPAERTKAYRQRQKLKRLTDESEPSVRTRKTSTQRTREHRERLKLKLLIEEADRQAQQRQAQAERIEYHERLKLMRLVEESERKAIIESSEDRERSQFAQEPEQHDTAVIPIKRDETQLNLCNAEGTSDASQAPSVKRDGRTTAEYMRAYRARQKLAKQQESDGLAPKRVKKNSTQRVRAHRERRRIAQVQQLFPEEIAEEYAHWCSGHFLSTHNFENQ